MTSAELEYRLIDFAVGCIKLTKTVVKSFAAEHMSGQLIRSSTSSALNYSESIGASSYRDYINKMQICLKELRESKTNLIIQSKSDFYEDNKATEYLIEEAFELVKIFSKSIATSKQNNKKI